ncbi:MAG: sulfotransferase [Phycisphaerales bacterium]|nr:sulfotransferase [Phycisphaerales bacterium]
MPQFYTEEESVQAVKKLISRKLFLNASTIIDENLAVFPDSRQLHFLSAHIALETKDFTTSISILEKLNKEDPNQIQILMPLARSWNMYGDIEKSFAYLVEAETAGADKTMIEVSRAEAFERRGDFDALDACVSKLPNEARFINIRALALIARKDYASAIDLLESCFEKGMLDIQNIISIQFTLAKAYDRIGEYDKAWCSAQKAHELDETPFDQDSYFAQFDQMTEFMNADLAPALAQGPSTEIEPLFIVGNPRSGTSLLEQILSMHPEVENGGEMCVGHAMQLNVSRLTDSFHAWPQNMIDIREDDARILSEEYIEANKSVGANEKIISNKALNLPLQLGFMSRILPSSRAVMLQRHPLDNAVSCYTTNLLVSGHAYTNSLESLGRTWVARKKIADHWMEVLSIPMMELHYENLVADQRGETERLIKFLDLPWQEDCMEFHKSDRVARTISYDQVNKKMYKTSSGRWKNYEKHLGPLIDVVSDYI